MASQTSKSSQEFVPIKEIRNDTVVLKDGSMRAVLMASSLNFALKSADEQTAIVTQFQDFLNSLDFSLQFFIQSRELDIRPYIAILEDRYEKQISDLMKVQIREYVEFIKSFTKNENIMTKNFFVVIPYTPPVIDVSKKISGIFKEKDFAEEKTSFEENETQLEQRIATVEQGLIRTGVRVVRLGTEELVELFYKIFNPGDLEKPIKIN
ncbi:MAG: TraC family protein [Candidatus Paceibacterota bacterium]